ncbi:MAG: aldehyde ferredoxin oxidoreductase N-terminal domain-containing protein [Pseudomonadota bacterium]
MDPLASGNNLIFAIGPAAGTSLRRSCRHGVYTKSPLTGFYSESCSGGSVADRIRSPSNSAYQKNGEVEVWPRLFVWT